jgi:hypothetical protein
MPAHGKQAKMLSTMKARADSFKLPSVAKLQYGLIDQLLVEADRLGFDTAALCNVRDLCKDLVNPAVNVDVNLVYNMLPCIIDLL